MVILVMLQGEINILFVGNIEQQMCSADVEQNAKPA
jgi:hypothetical protein